MCFVWRFILQFMHSVTYVRHAQVPPTTKIFNMQLCVHGTDHGVKSNSNLQNDAAPTCPHCKHASVHLIDGFVRAKLCELKVYCLNSNKVTLLHEQQPSLT